MTRTRNPDSSPEDLDQLRVTSLRDVARAAGVSVSTASRVLSGSSHPVSQATQELVRDAAARLGFEPNRVARALATARSQTIGVVVHDVSDPYFAEIVRGLENVAGPRDHALFVSSSDRDPDKELSLVKTFVSNRVDAIVLAASGLSDADAMERIGAVLSRFESLGGVVVCMSEHPYAAPRVTYDNRGAMAQITRHLIELGHRKIGFLAGPPDLIVGSVRFSGFESALDEAGIAPDPELVECGWFSMDEGAAATTRLMQRAHPTAIVAGNDLMALGALRRLLDMGYRVPDDVSVVGFDDVEFAAYASVPLTTVHVPLTEFGQLGAELVLDLLDGRAPEHYPTVQPRLVVRSSTSP
ncbi:MAG: LacI family DNA-binding transcriptional regulator, partial [Acidimicrobiia bacterium]